MLFIITNKTDITKDAAREHENWFVKFEELKAKQKEAIIKWKNEKKNIVMYNNDSNTSDPLKKCADNVPEISLKVRSVVNDYFSPDL